MVAAPRLGDGIGGVLVGDAMLAQDDLGVDAGIVEPAEHLDHAARRHPGRTGPALDLHRDHVAVGRRQGVARGRPSPRRRAGCRTARPPRRGARAGSGRRPRRCAARGSRAPGPRSGRRRVAARFAPAPDRRASRRRGALSGTKTSALPATSGSTNANPPAWPCSRPVISSRRSGSARRRPPITTRRPSATRPFSEPPERRALARRDAESRGERARRLWRPGMAADGGENRIGVGHDGRGRDRRRQAYQAGEISSTCRSPTLVPVGPGCQRSPSCAKYA